MTYRNTELTLRITVFSEWVFVNYPWPYRKIPKISPGAYVFQRPFLRGLYRRGLSTEGNLCFKIDLASLIVGRKFTVFALLYFVFDGKYKPGGLYLEGRFNGGFFRLRVLGAYIWRGLFSEFYGICRHGTGRLPLTTEKQLGYCIALRGSCLTHIWADMVGCEHVPQPSRRNGVSHGFCNH